MLVLTGTTWAASLACPAAVPSLAEALGGGATEVEIQAGCDLATVPAALSGRSVTITCLVDPCELPPLQLDGGALTLVNAQLASTAAFAVGADHPSATTLERTPASVYVEDGALTLEGVAVADPGAVVTLDSSVTVLDSSFSGLSSPALSLWADTDTPTVDVVRSRFVDARATSLYVRSLRGARVATVQVTDCDFEGGITAEGEISVVASSVTLQGVDLDNVSCTGDAPVDLDARSVHVERGSFVDTWATYVGTVYVRSTGGEVTLLDTAILPVNTAEWTFKAALQTLVHIEGATWAAVNPSWVSGTNVEILDSRFLLDPQGGEEAALFWTDSSTFRFEDNEVCGTEERASSRNGLLQGTLSTLLVNDNVFHGLVFPDGPVVSTFALDGRAPGNPSAVKLIDNTFIAVQAEALLLGDVTELDFRNNLVWDSTSALSPYAWPLTLTGDYNLWGDPDEVLTLELGLGWGTHDLYNKTPLFVSTYQEGVCGSWPAPEAKSPVVDAGDPALPADDERSDIGAADLDELPWEGTRDTGDTGDTGSGGDTSDTPDTSDTATDTSDTAHVGADRDEDGVADPDDCAPDDPRVYPGAPDDPTNTLDEDCDGVAASVSYAGSCGCAAGPGRSAAGPGRRGAALSLPGALALLLLARRRG